jgi:hypothetical protein
MDVTAYTSLSASTSSVPTEAMGAVVDLRVKVHIDPAEFVFGETNLRAIGYVLGSMKHMMSTLPKSDKPNIPVEPKPQEPSNIIVRSVITVVRLTSFAVTIHGPADPDDKLERGICAFIGGIELHADINHERPPALKGHIQSVGVTTYVDPLELPTARNTRRTSMAEKSAVEECILSIDTANIFTDADKDARKPIVCHVPAINIQLTLTGIYALITAVGHITLTLDKGKVKSDDVVSKAPVVAPPAESADAAISANSTNNNSSSAFTLEILAINADMHLANKLYLGVRVRCVRAGQSEGRWYADVESLHMLGRAPDTHREVRIITLLGLHVSPSVMQGGSRDTATSNAGAFSPKLSKASHTRNNSSVTDSTGSNFGSAPYISVSATSLKLTIPYKYKMSNIIENVNNTIKSTKYLLSRVRTGNPPPHSVTHVDLPRVEIRIVELAVELQDSPFEVALARIFRVGMLEQRQRIARDTVMASRMKEIAADPTQHGSVDEDLAQYMLHEYNSNNWIRKIRSHMNEHKKQPPLAHIAMRHAAIKLGPPHFGRPNIGQWVYSLDNSTPYDYEYDLAILMHLNISAGELIARLRDFPQPLLHFMPAPSSRSRINPVSFVWDGDLGILEQMPLDCSFRYIPVPICENVTGISARTISPVKIYTDTTIRILHGSETRVCWGPCYGPTLSLLAQIMDTITEPSPDPSPALGWWDKLRLILHGLVRFDWANGGRFRIFLRGGQHPWQNDMHSSGLELVWQDRVNMIIGGEKNVFELHCREFLVAIPEVRTMEREKSEFAKILLRLSGDIVFGCAFRMQPPPTITNWLPHHAVITRMPNFVNSPDYDSFYGFRAGKVNIDTFIQANNTQTVSGKSHSGNSFYFAPAAWDHCTSFFSLFGMVQAPPAPIYPNNAAAQNRPPPFGKYLNSVRFNLSLDPISVGYFVRDEDAAEDEDDMILRGIKARARRLDLEMVMEQDKRSKSTNKDGKSDEGLSLQDVLVDILELDVRAITVHQINVGYAEALRTTDADLADLVADSDGALGEEDIVWLDGADYDDVDMLTVHRVDSIKVTPFAYSPRAIFFKQGNCISPEHRISVDGKGK